jgi:hypothetical protein
VHPPQVKRNASAFVIARNHSHTTLKKNYSSGHLPRNLSGKILNNKGAQQHKTPAPKRKHSGRSERSVPASPISSSPPVEHQQPTVRFALADEEPESGQDEEAGWTEESASVSPNVTRDNTRHNSVVLDPASMMAAKDHSVLHDVTSGEESTNTVIHAPEGSTTTGRRQESGKQSSAQEAATKHINGESSYPSSTRQPVLDADAITSRLLQRKAPPSHGAEPQLSSVSAIVQPDVHDHRSLSHSSQTSTLAEGTPGRDLVSRFVNANSVDGTPKDGNMLPTKGSAVTDDSELDATKRNQSAPDMADRGPISPKIAHTRTASRRSGTSTPSTDLPPSRTQQKLLLQRASSAIEPQKHIPAVLPRPGAAQLLGHGLSFTSAEGGAPAQLHAIFAQINKEYIVVRRYRNPVADAAARAKEIPRPERRTAVRQRRASTGRTDENGVSIDGHESPIGGFERHHHAHEGHGRHSRHERAVDQNDSDRRPHHTHKKPEGHGHKSRVSFDLSNVRTEDSDDDRTPSRVGSMRTRDEAYEICRRMWELGEVEGGG